MPGVMSQECLVSVVVLTYNRPESLRRGLEALATQTLDRSAYEVVIVDASDEPVTGLIAGFSGRFALRHVVVANGGVAINRNAGARQARGRFLAFVDDDCVAAPDWLAELVAAAVRHPGALVGGGVDNAVAENACAAAGQVIAEVVDAHFNPPGAEPTFFPGLNFAVERGRFLELGGNDPRFGRLAAEDREFVDRWRRAGGWLLACPAARVRHEHRTSLRRFLRQHIHYGRGAWRYRTLGRDLPPLPPARSEGLQQHLLASLRGPMRRVPARLRWRVWALLGLWQVAYPVGILGQALAETLAAWGPARPPAEAWSRPTAIEAL